MGLNFMIASLISLRNCTPITSCSVLIVSVSVSIPAAISVGVFLVSVLGRGLPWVFIPIPINDPGPSFPWGYVPCNRCVLFAISRAPNELDENENGIENRTSRFSPSMEASEFTSSDLFYIGGGKVEMLDLIYRGF